MTKRAEQKSYRIDCPECRGSGRVRKYIGHEGRAAVFVCFACTSDDPVNEGAKPAS